MTYVSDSQGLDGSSDGGPGRGGRGGDRLQVGGWRGPDPLHRPAPAPGGCQDPGDRPPRGRHRRR